ncbi:MAG: hypothetical protein J2P20_15555 [Pseudonocardia sp.]|nr:hypothetical protein [Pseudonocardia sp.]MBO0874209.1 hypothetical protein [Pseudonocardia sp.]
MPGDQEPSPSNGADQAARRRRLADVFGDVLPDATEDDAPDPVTRAGQPADPTERWYTENRPPHHDRESHS